ncbi:MAG: nucleotidyltransferase family protein [Candidatus Aenigmarchaeota archaeon]|nr:nucleotidyltransferase family protein [Candidatus Aenigmarchaeota archaeon]
MKNMKNTTRNSKKLLELASDLFENCRNVEMCVIGGLAAQELLTKKSKRETSDLDLVAKNEKDAEEVVKYLRDMGYKVSKNEKLAKYSATKDEEKMHVDIYIGRIGEYVFDEKTWENVKIIEDSYGKFRVISTEDLIAIKMYAYLSSCLESKKGDKHLIDIYTLLTHGRYEVNYEYLAERIEYLSRILSLNPREILNTLVSVKKSLMEQFSNVEEKRLNNTLRGMKEKIEGYLYSSKG